MLTQATFTSEARMALISHRAGGAVHTEEEVGRRTRWRDAVFVHLSPPPPLPPRPLISGEVGGKGNQDVRQRWWRKQEDC